MQLVTSNARNLMERRRHPRIEVHLPAIYRSQKRTMDTYVSNVSQGGLAVLGPSVDDVGTHCQVVVTLPDEDPLELNGRIIWSDADKPCMGFCFEGLTRDQRVTLTNFLLARLYNG